MKSFLRAVMVMMVLVLGSQFVRAQELKPKQKERVEKELKELTDVMKLDAEQQEKIYKVKVEQTLEKAEMFKQHEKGSDAFKAANKAMNKKYWAKTKEIVSKEQMASWTAYKKK